MMKERLTRRQHQAYELIRSYIRMHKKPPTMKEIADAMDIKSTNGVYKMLQILERKGYIERDKNTARGIKLADSEDLFSNGVDIPKLILVSRTSSNETEKLRHRPSAYLSVDPYFLLGVSNYDECLLARVDDDGMIGAGINKGDFLIIEEAPQNDIKSGEIIGLLVRNRYIARYYYPIEGSIHLRPAGRTFTEESFSQNDPNCFIMGRVISVMRRLFQKSENMY